MRLRWAAALLLACPLPALAWGTTAHRLVARVAAADLPADVNTAVKSLLGTQSLVDVSTLPDTWSSSRPETRVWHFVDIPLKERTYDARRDCAEDDCLVGAFQKFQSVLADRSATNSARKEALIYLVHLIADAHQPLHAANNNDSAGNTVKIRYANQPSNLHRYWDTTVLAAASQDEAGYAARLTRSLASRRDTASIQKGDIESWVNESHALAAQVYRIPSSGALDKKYIDWSRQVADDRIIRAALRLRAVLIRELSSGRVPK